MATKPKEIDAPTRVIKRKTCPTVSGKSEITYQLGVDPDDRLVLRIHSNDGGGFFSAPLPGTALLLLAGC